VRLRRQLFALVLAAGCQSSSLPSPCPGQALGTLVFTGVPSASDGGTCYFASDAGTAFTAEIASGSGTSAYLCAQRTDAAPFEGTLEGDHLVLSSTFPPNDVAGCNCLVVVTETVQGDLERALGPGTPVTGFDGGLTVDIVPAPDAGTCEPVSSVPDAGPSCGVPCEVQQGLVGSQGP